MSALEIATERRDQAVLITLRGDLDLAEFDRLEKLVLELEQEEPSLIVLDMRELAFIDSTGIRLVLQADQRAREDGRRLAIVRGPEPVDRVFRIALLDKRLQFVEDPSELETR